MSTALLESAFTSKKWQWKIYASERGASRLVNFLSLKLPHIEKSTWQERLQIGGVYVNGLVAREDLELKLPCKIEYYEPKTPLSEIAGQFASQDECHVVFEDRFLAVVLKPARLSCMPAKEQQVYNLKTYLENQFEPSLHMPSRLDMSTQGLVVVSKHPLCHLPLQRAFEKRCIEKRYLAEVSGLPNWRFKNVVTGIEKDPAHPVLRRISFGRGKIGQTIFRAALFQTNAEELGGRCVILARPLTGRTHQIRVHASHLGHPIIGDKFYGGTVAPQLHLFSYALHFRHPITKGYLKIKTPAELLPLWLTSENIYRLEQAGHI